MSIKSMLSLFIILVVYFAIYFFVYLSATKFFDLNQGSKKILAITLIFLSISFILSAILSRFSGFFIFNYFYIFSAFWMGLVINLVFFLALSWIFGALLGALQIDAKSVLGIIAITLSISYSFYGVWLARNPLVRKMEIEIEHIPEEWKGKTAVQISDLHLGRVNGKKFSQKIVNMVNDLDAEIIFITGDLFDGMGSDIEVYAGIMNKLKSEKGVYFVTGNHEVYLGKAKALEAIERTNIKVLEDKVVEIEGLQIVGVGHTEFGEIRKPGFIRNLEGFQSEKPTILLYHVPVSVVQEENASDHQSSIYWAPKTDFKEAKESGVNLQLSGHTHDGQIFPFTYLTKLIYNGFSYGLVKDGDFSVYTSSGAGTWGPPMRTASHSEIVSIKLK